MSVRVMTRCWEHSQAKGTDLLVLLALADVADDDGECWPSMAFIARKARLAPRNARARIRSLEQLGEVVVIENGGKASTRGGLRSNRYRITVHLDDDDTDASIPIEPAEIRTPASASDDDDTDASIPQIRMPASARIRMPASAESSIEPSVNRHFAPARRDALFDALADACGMNAAELTAAARGSLNAALADLRRVGAQPDDIAERAVAYRRRYPQMAVTPSALAKHWPSLSSASPAGRDQIGRVAEMARSAGR